MASIDSFDFNESLDRVEYHKRVFKFVSREKLTSNEDLLHLLEQVELSIPKDDITYHSCKLISTIYSIIFSRLLTNGYFKFQVILVELADKYRSVLDTAKLSSKNVYTPEKKLAVVCLSVIFLKFGGFLNSFKSSVLTSSYKHLKKLTDNVSKNFDSNYLDQFLILIDVILNANPNLDSKTLQRLLKIHKLISSKGKVYTREKEYFTFSILSVIHSNNILTTLLKTPLFIDSILTRKSHHKNPLHYLQSISIHLSHLISCADTRYKNLRLASTKNIATLLVFSYVNYGVDENESKVFNFTVKYLWTQYLKIGSNKKIRTGIIESLIQFMSDLNLVFETGVLPNPKNLISFKSFDILGQTLETIFAEKSEEDVIKIDNKSDFNFVTLIFNHLQIFFKHLLSQIRSDVNKLINLQHIFDEYIKDGTTVSNNYKCLCLLQFSQIIIEDLGQYIYTHESSKMEELLLNLSKNRNPYIRLLSVDILTKLAVDSDKIISDSFVSLNNLIGNNALERASQQDTFIESHSYCLLISHMISSTDSISTDLILSILSLSNSILKKFNSNVLINNLINGTDFSTLSNTNYEKQVSSWILMMGLFNHHQRQANPFLIGSNPLLNIWKSLLAHNVPSNFVRIENNKVVNFNELMKFVEIKNYALSCLICFIDYAISLNSMPPDFAKQLNPLLTKCYSFITTVEQQLPSSVPSQLFKAIEIQKLRILTNFVKIVPHIIQLSDTVNLSTDLLISVVKNFNDYKSFNYKLSSDVSKATDSRRQPIEPSETDIYEVEDGLLFGLTSKLNLLEVDEILFKKCGKCVSSNADHDIDLVPNSSDFIIESKYHKSNLSPISKFDDLEHMIYQPIQPSVLNDYLFLLISNSKPYSSTMRDVVPVETATIDLSIELFQLVFPYLSLKIQQSILESIRSGILHSPELIKQVTSTTGADKSIVQNSTFNFERQQLVILNSSLTLHGMLNHLTMKNMDHLKLNRMITNLILETLKRVPTDDLVLINMNAESVGLCLSVLDQENNRLINESVNYFINLIVENDDPYSRAFSLLSLGNIFKFNSLITPLSKIMDVILKLVLDPHPIVNHWCLETLILVLENYHDYGGSELLASQIIKTLEIINDSDDFGLLSKSVVCSNLSMTYEGGDKIVLISKILRIISKLIGPGMKFSPLRSHLENLVMQILFTTTSNFDLVSRELLILFDELNIFDRELIPHGIFLGYMKFLLYSNAKTGAYNENQVQLPFVGQLMESEEFSNEIFPMTTSHILIESVINSLYQWVKIISSQKELRAILDSDLQNAAWILLESNNDQLYEIFKIWMDLDFSKDLVKEYKVGWVEDLISKFESSEKELYKPLNDLFRKRFNASTSLFASKTKTAPPIKQGTHETRSFASKAPAHGEADDEDNESDASEEATVMASSNISEDATPVESNFEKESTDVNTEINGAKLQQISDQEPVRWTFKLKVLNLLKQLLSYSSNDEFTFKYLSTKLSDLVRISFIACTSQMLELRSLGLSLLKDILDRFAHLRDPLYDNLSILDQQQAQIISAILPAFTSDSNIWLACEGFNTASALIGSGITSLSRLQRLSKILVTSLYDLSLLKANKKSDSLLKIGEVSVKSTKEQNRVTLAVLNAWAHLKIVCCEEDADENLKAIVAEHLKALTSLWIYSLKQYAMLKYGKEFMDTEGLVTDTYEQYWQSMLMAVSIVIKDEPALIEEILGAELDNFFFAVFAQCVEILFKTNTFSVEILEVLRNILSLKASSKIIYHELVFAETVDLFDRLILNSNNAQKSVLLDIISELYFSYFDNRVSDSRSEQDLHKDVDKLFELLRLVMAFIIQILPFVRDKELIREKLRAFEGADMKILKKSFTALISMIDRLPSVIRLDLYSCLLFMISLIYELDNDDVIGVMLPSLKRILIDLSLEGQEKLLSSWYHKVSPLLHNSSSVNTLITYMIVTTSTSKSLGFSDKDYEHIADLLMTSSKQPDSMAIAMRSMKTIMIKSEEVNASQILKRLIPKLVTSLTSGDAKEPKIVLELLIIFVKNLPDSNYSSSLQLMIPLLLWYAKEDGEYVRFKLLQLIQYNPEALKSFISEKVTVEERDTIEELVKARPQQQGADRFDSPEQEHIDLKMFGVAE